MNAGKLLERKFAVPSSAGILALVNDAAGMGFDFKVMVLVVASSIAWAAIEAWVDVARIKSGSTTKEPVKA